MSEELLAKRRDRAIAIILRVKETEADAYLPSDVSSRLRKVILDQLNELYDFACDLTKVPTGEVVLNELYLQKLNEVHAAIVGSSA